MEIIALAALPRDVDSTDSESRASGVSERSPIDLSRSRWPTYRSVSISDVSSPPLSSPYHSPREVEVQDSEESEEHANTEYLPSQEDAVFAHFVANGTHANLTSDYLKLGQDEAICRSSQRATWAFCPSLQQIQENILQPLLAKTSLQEFHPIVKDCPRRMLSKETVCLRDLENTLIRLAFEKARTAQSLLTFGHAALRFIQVTVEHLSDKEKVRPREKSYTNGYIVDLRNRLIMFSQQLQVAKDNATQDELHSRTLRSDPETSGGSDGVRKQNSRFDIPASRTLDNIDQFIAQSNNEKESAQLKQKKGLLMNRQAALDSISAKLASNPSATSYLGAEIKFFDDVATNSRPAEFDTLRNKGEAFLDSTGLQVETTEVVSSVSHTQSIQRGLSEEADKDEEVAEILRDVERRLKKKLSRRIVSQTMQRARLQQSIHAPL